MISEYHGRPVSGLANSIVERLQTVGARALFGVPGGGGNLDLIEAARGAGLPFVLTSTETGAAIAALAQADVLGRPGACLTTLGPGAASVVNGVACAHLDRAPMMVFTDSNPAGARGAFTHQQFDHVALFKPITKWSARLESGRACQTLDEAFRTVLTVPPGPVHIDCPGDVTALDDGDDFHVTTEDTMVSDGFTALVARARKPLLLIGLGARHGGDPAAIGRLCERLHVPAMVTYKAKGVVSDTHECFAGVFTNGAIERALIDQSDLLIGIGLDPVELLPRPWTVTSPIVAIGRWLAPVDHVPFTAQWVTDIPAAVTMLETVMRTTEWDLDDVTRTVNAQRRLIDVPGDGTGMPAQRVVAIAADALAPTHRVTVDAGAHMFPATMTWPVREANGLLISNGLSTMGFALPAAIGAALADRERPVVALTGDGGLLMCAGELLTAARERLRIIVIVFNDASLSLIEIKQHSRRLPPGGVSLGPVAWATLAEAFGVAAFTAATDSELARAIEAATSRDGPSLIDARIDRSNYGKMLRAIRG